MNRQAVDSSNISSIGYDPISKTLEVEFTTGAVYQYDRVPENVWREFVGSSSIGRYFHSDIKGVYEYQRV